MSRFKVKKYLLNVLITFLIAFLLGSCSSSSKFNNTFYNVNFYIDDNLYFSEKIMSGQRCSEIMAPNKSTYQFKYWVDENDNLFKINDSTKINGNLNLYAYYEYNEDLAKCSISSKEITGNFLVKNTTKFQDSFLWFKWSSKTDCLGSAVVFNKIGSTYYALTNSHCILGNNEKIAEQALDSSFFTIEVADYNENVISAEVVYYDVNYDLGILKFNSNNDYYVAPLANIEGSKCDKVIAVGNPYGKRNIITFGSINDFPTVKIWSSEKVSNVEFPVIQSSTECHPGNSGGPLYNDKLEIVGINYAGSNFLWKHITYSIGINMINEFLQTFSDRSYL